MYYNVLQCITMYYSVLQCIAMYYIIRMCCFWNEIGMAYDLSQQKAGDIWLWWEFLFPKTTQTKPWFSSIHVGVLGAFSMTGWNESKRVFPPYEWPAEISRYNIRHHPTQTSCETDAIDHLHQQLYAPGHSFFCDQKSAVKLSRMQ